jgi:hypothetical protein
MCKSDNTERLEAGLIVFYIYEIAERTPQQKIGGNITMSLVS